MTAFNNSREYWQPQLDDPQLNAFKKLTLDSMGFAESRTAGVWTFDLAAHSILALLEALNEQAVVIGDSMGGGPTGLRCALLDAERTRRGAVSRITGVVACGTSAEEESEGV
jgi:pimeloyl-ACP methyl ester carboxylesterase